MAHNGGPRVPPRPPPAGVHATPSRNIPPPPPPPTGVGPGNGVRAPATMNINLPPVTAPLSPLVGSRHRTTRRVSPARPDNAPPRTPVSLTSPRPDGERLSNEYVETPVSSRNPATLNATPVVSNTQSKSTHHRPETLSLPAVITKQPQASFIKNQHHHHHHHSHRTLSEECHSVVPSGVVVGTRGGASTPGAGSIICPECGRCRCESCQQPRPLPQRWVCDKKCLCSVDAIIDYTSCLCCVKGLYYHCSKDYERDRDGDGVSCADEPCSCAPHHRMTRWGCLLALTSVLPCLLFYWPLRGCARGIEMVYAHQTRSGCRCSPPTPQDNTLTTPEKRLLDSSPDF